MTGAEIKNYILSNGVRLWQVAERWGISDGNFSRRLRKPFSKSEFARIEKIVKTILESREEEEDNEAV